ncbi:hypothetical protein GOP47_0017444 [Adiantum capillus-veneris]|uniref:Pentatricopeptide repeat-containing protein n=1 Tax=Adiantum capillus-veneris TaxID=13818 RepID=A0A9D4UGK6_ADICA|nr:hypothetical protein GOP47_0017444 [Adiantum capillus-veneris]
MRYLLEPKQGCEAQGNAWMAMLHSRTTPSMHMCSASNPISCANSLRIPQGATTSSARWTQLRFQIKSMQSCRGSHNPCSIVITASDQATSNNPYKQATKQRHRPGRSKRHYHFFNRTAQSETGTKAANLVDIVMSLSNVKEEIYATLDEWLAFEIVFPKIAVGKALSRLKQQEQWQRIIQVSKWMWSKGQGKTIGIYGLMLRAYEMDSRLEDCKILWEKILMRYGKSMPKSMFVRMLHIYKRQQMPGELVKVFEQMESLKIRPAADTLVLVKDAYRQIGKPEMEQTLNARYPPPWKYLHYKDRFVKVRPRPTSTADSEAGETKDDL